MTCEADLPGPRRPRRIRQQYRLLSQGRVGSRGRPCHVEGRPHSIRRCADSSSGAIIRNNCRTSLGEPKDDMRRERLSASLPISLVLATILAWGLVPVLARAETPGTGKVDFRRDILPILSDN